MDSDPLFDAYAALGVAKDAPAATIKSTYRKLVLKCHPDKVTDESLKQQKQEEFHKIQQAYELIGDDEKRSSYDARVKLEKLRKEKQSRSGGAEVRTARYETRTAAPGGATFAANGPPRYEERKPSRPYNDDRYHEERSSRKYDTYEAYPKHSSSRSSRKEEPVKVSSKTADRTRSDQRKTRDREERRERSGRFVHISDESSSNDEKTQYEANYRRRNNEEQARNIAAEARRKANEQRSYEEPKERRYYSSDDREFNRERKLSSQENDAVRYIHRSKVEADRPSPSRTTSSRDVRPDAYESRSRSSRPEPVRRSSARPKDRDLRKGMPEIVDWSEPDRKPPSFKQSSSSPADLHVPRATPQRSYTESSRDHRRTETSPPTPVFRRSETMPSVPHRRKEATVTRPSGLRSSESASPPEPEPVYATVPPPQSSSSRKYYYPTPGGGVSLRADDVGVANGHRTVLREPDRRTRSPSPLSRPPMGPNRHVETSSAKYQPQPPAPAPPRTTSATIPPPLSRASTFNATPAYPEQRGRSGRLYGEIPKRENDRRQTSYSPDTVQYSRKFGSDDIRWSGRDDMRQKPTLGRHPTYVC